MRKVRLEFASRRSPLQVAGWILLPTALTISTYVSHAIYQGNARLALLQADVARLEVSARVAAPVALSGDELKRREAEIGAINSVIGRLAIPWNDLFNEVEAADDEKNVSLIAVEPDPDTRAVLITAEAREMQAMLDYAKRIAGSSRLKDAYIKSHQVQTADPQRPVRFVLSARWALPSVERNGG